MFTVGVVEAHEKTTSSIISRLLKLNNYKINIFEANNDVSLQKCLKEYIKILDNSGTDVLLISIDFNSKDINYYDEIEFDLITLTTIQDKLSNMNRFQNISNVFTKLKKKSYVIMNIDDKNHIRQLQGVRTCIITYGLNSKATITASSINDSNNKLLICQQRSIISLFDKVIEPQEILINLQKYNRQNIYLSLAVVSTCLVFNVDNKLFNKVNL